MTWTTTLDQINLRAEEARDQAHPRLAISGSKGAHRGVERASRAYLDRLSWGRDGPQRGQHNKGSSSSDTVAKRRKRRSGGTTMNHTHCDALHCTALHGTTTGDAGDRNGELQSHA